MANTATSWDTASPSNGENVKDGAQEIRFLRTGIATRANKEHVAAGASDAGGEHKPGSAVAFYAGSAPTQRPDAATALDNVNDRGRLWLDGGVLKYWNGTTWTAISGSASYSVAILSDQKAAGTTGGSFTAGSWQTRTLNTELDPSAIVSLSANAFTLAAGTYEVCVEAPMFAANGHQARLYNVTDAAVQALGSCEWSMATSPFNQTSSFIRTVFTLAGTKVLRVEHRTESNATAGRSPSSAFGVSVVYTQVTIRKLA
jgi:hypothetical protein